MILYCNGCSHTRGTHWSLKNHDRSLTWPNNLAKKLEADLIDDSKEGASNFRIFKTSVDTINKKETKPDLVIIQWTHNERFITPLGINEKNPAEPKGFRTHNPYNAIINSYKHSDYNASNGVLPPHVTFYQEFYNPDSESQKLFIEEQAFFYIYMMQVFLELNEIDYIFLKYDGTRNRQTKQMNRYLKLLDFNKFLHQPFNGMEKILESYNYQRAKRKKPDNTVDMHFTEDAHDFISEAILDFHIIGQKLELNRGTNKFSRRTPIIHFYDEDL